MGNSKSVEDRARQWILRQTGRFEPDNPLLEADIRDLASFARSETASLRAENERITKALNTAIYCFERLLANQKDCGDPNAECPMQDAHKEKYDFEVAGALKIARQALTAQADKDETK